jgi:uncharacterized protein YifN (PemK superfamily)
MPHAFRIFKKLKALGYSDSQSSAFADVVEIAKTNGRKYLKETTEDTLFDGGFPEGQAEAIAAVLRNCFASEVFCVHFDETRLKFDLVRASIPSFKADGIIAAVRPAIVTRQDAYPRVPIRYVPSPGRVLMCDFTHLAYPEMIKERRAIVVSKGSSERCAVVVPVSKKETNEGNPKYHKFEASSYPFFHKEQPVWAICDHVYTVSLMRTWQVVVLKRPSIPSISASDFTQIKRLLGTSLGLQG